jgi:hypothetical protein
VVVRNHLTLVAAVWIGGCAGQDSTQTTPTGPVAVADAPPLPTSSSPAVPASAAIPLPDPLAELDIAPSSFDFSKHADLTKRIAETPHAYFRFIGHDFARVTCKRFEAQNGSVPRVRLHGDPHVEQYAVTDLGYGITDYDDASVGPQVVDLVRMSTSARLAVRELGWTDAEEAFVDELFRGYRAGLDGQAAPNQPPAFAQKLKKKFAKDRKAFLDFVESNMVPIEPNEGEKDGSTERGEAFVRKMLQTYVSLVKDDKPKRPATFFDVKKLGATRLGIGSALTRKFVIRLEGVTASADDDLVVELKQVAYLGSIPCVTPVPGGAAEHRAEEQKRAGQEKRLLSPKLLPDGRFWVNEWLANYFEVRINRLESKDDLRALLFAAGVNLAHEHQKPLLDGAPAPKKELLIPSDALKSSVMATSGELADSVRKGWQRFRWEVGGMR